MNIILIGETCVTILTAILLFLFFPILIILSLPFWIIRILVGKLAKFVNPRLGKMVNTMGSALAADGVFKRPETNCGVQTVLEGNVDVEKASELIGPRLSAARLPNGDLKYPELKQYLTTWLGYWYFKDDPDFDFKNHIKLHERCTGDGDHFTQQDIDDFFEENLNKKWKKRRPAWELTFVPNCFPNNAKDPGPHTLFLLSFHHVMGDGYSWLPMIVKDVCQSDITFPQPNYVKRSLCSSILFGICFPFRAAYEFAEVVIIALKKLPFRVSKKQTGKYFTKTTDRIPIKKLKEIKKFFNVSFSSVLYSVTGGAIREFLIKNEMEVPTTLPGVIVQPLENHTEKLRNYMTAIIIHFPTGENDPLARLQFCENNQKSQKNSTIPIVLHYFMIIVGSYFEWILKFVGRNYMIPIGLTNFAAGNKKMWFNGAKQHKWTDHYFAGGLQHGVCGLAIASGSFIDSIRFTIVGDSDVLSKKDVLDLSELLEREIDNLHMRVAIDAV